MSGNLPGNTQKYYPFDQEQNPGPSQKNPNQSNQLNQSDYWTRIAGLTEAITSAVSNFFWLGLSFDMFRRVAGFKINTLMGISKQGIIFGAVMSGLTTAGGVYCHHIQRLRQQKNYAPLFLDEHAPLTSSRSNLTLFQKIALSADAIGHIGEVTGPLNFITQLASENKLKASTYLIANAGWTVFGAIAAYADVRTCKHNLIAYNQEQAGLPTQTTQTYDTYEQTETTTETIKEQQEELSDCWTKIDFVAAIVTRFINFGFWFSSLVDLIGSFAINTSLGVSLPGLAVGIPLGLMISIGAGYSELVQSTNHQNAAYLRASIMTTHLPLSQKLCVACTWISAAYDRIAPLTYALQIATQSQKLSQSTNLASIGAFVAFGILGGWSDARVSIGNFLKSNE